MAMAAKQGGRAVQASVLLFDQLSLTLRDLNAIAFTAQCFSNMPSRLSPEKKINTTFILYMERVLGKMAQ